jgi:hypothetical protein
VKKFLKLEAEKTFHLLHGVRPPLCVNSRIGRARCKECFEVEMRRGRGDRRLEEGS